jgi:Flp pilus assembly protein TadG
MRRRRRTSQAGQMLVITALLATVIFGAMAFSVDLSLNTFNQRTLQNVADAAALAGATDLTGLAPTGAEQQKGVADAVKTITKNPGLGGVSGTMTACTSGALTGYCETATFATYTVFISTPPQNARGATNDTVNDFEVDIYDAVKNNFGTAVGAPNSTVAAHAVAYHLGPPSPYDYTFFSATQLSSGNQQESIYGDAYVGNGYQPQSSGKAGLCVYENAGPESASFDTDGDTGIAQDNDLDDQGHVTFGAVPPTVGSDPTYATSTSPCPGSGQFQAQAVAPQSTAPTNCPLGSTPKQDGVGWQCYMPNPPVPSITLPTPNAGTLCNGTANALNTGPGIYSVGPGCSLNLSFAKGDINCVDLVLQPGASVNVVDKKGQNFMTSWDYSSSDTTATGALGKLLPKPTPFPPASCPGVSGTAAQLDNTPTHADSCIICAASTTVLPMPVALSNSSTGCCSDSLFVGTIFLPGQEISFATNQAMEDVGQVYCGLWNVQSGNHPNPLVTRDAGGTALQAELLRLAE